MNSGQTLTFVSLFKKDGVERVEIPIIQRDYAQGRASAVDVRMPFLKTIQETLLLSEEELEQPLDLDFIYGSFVAGSQKAFSVLDGQQRLTTLFLLHWYLASLDGEMDDFRQRWVDQGHSRFTYKTRHSSTEFFDALSAADINIEACQSMRLTLSEALVDCQWFFRSWRQDPTIQSCIVMLDTINELFADTAGLYQKLIKTEDPYITFQYLNLEEFGLSDDLYIKMNARGKPLTAFENFKAWLFGQIHEQDFSGEFERQVDQEWTDIFWQISQKMKSDFDTLFLRFFYLMSFFDACKNTGGSYSVRDQGTRGWLTELRNADGFISLQKLEKNNAFNVQVLQHVSAFLEFYRSETGESQKGFFESALGRNSDFVTQAKLYVLVLFALAANASDDSPDEKEIQLQRWLRVTDNLIHNTRIDELPTFLPVVKGLHTLSQHCLDIYTGLADMESLSGFGHAQTEEEILKAKLILGDSNWEPLLKKYEDHDYLKGKVGFLLKYAKVDENTHDLAIFEANAKKAHAVLSEKILKSDEYLLQRALLTLDNYLISSGGREYSFGVPKNTTFRDRDENWLKVVNKPVFKALLNLVNEDIPKSLRNLIGKVTCGGWRQMIVENPETIRYCKRGFVHQEGNDIYLLTKYRRSGYHAELKSYVLFLELDRLNQEQELPDFIENVAYYPTYGDALPGVYFTFENDAPVRLCYRGNKAVAFEYDSKTGYGDEMDVPEPLAKYLELPLAEEVAT